MFGLTVHVFTCSIEEILFCKGSLEKRTDHSIIEVVLLLQLYVCSNRPETELKSVFIRVGRMYGEDYVDGMLPFGLCSAPKNLMIIAVVHILECTYMPTVPDFPGLSRKLKHCPGVPETLEKSRKRTRLASFPDLV